MVEIAREYMRRMGITNTQYIVSRHTDREHQHLHIVANRVDNDGNTISASNDRVRNVKICKALTREYGLHFSKGKMNVKRDRLRGKDKMKYQIYDAIKAALPLCNCWSDLCDRLAKQGIGVHFKLDRRNGNIVGVSFTKNEISFSGSRIDRSMSFYKLDRLFGSCIAEGMEWQPHMPDKGFDGWTSPTMQGIATDSRAADTFIGQPSSAGAETDSNGGNPAESGFNIVQVTIGTLMELCVQPHQAKVSSGGGGCTLVFFALFAISWVQWHEYRDENRRLRTVADKHKVTTVMLNELHPGLAVTTGEYEKLTETVGVDSTLTIFWKQVKNVKQKSK